MTQRERILTEFMPEHRRSAPVRPSLAEPVVLCWSGGKDSALALHRLQQDPRYRVVGLITMLTSDDAVVPRVETCERQISNASAVPNAADRSVVSMHRVSKRLIQRQAESLNCSLVFAETPAFPKNDIYRAAFAKAVDRFRSMGVRTVAFGDLFLEDIREFREDLCATLGLTAIFPLWRQDTQELLAEFVLHGFGAVVCCCDARRLGRDQVGREYNQDWIRALPAGIDPLGENGEFHTFVYDAPWFRHPIAWAAGQVYEQTGHWYCELTEVTCGEGPVKAAAFGSPSSSPCVVEKRHA